MSNIIIIIIIAIIALLPNTTTKNMKVVDVYEDTISVVDTNNEVYEFYGDEYSIGDDVRVTFIGDAIVAAKKVGEQ